MKVPLEFNAKQECQDSENPSEVGSYHFRDNSSQLRQLSSIHVTMESQLSKTTALHQPWPAPGWEPAIGRSRGSSTPSRLGWTEAAGNCSPSAGPKMWGLDLPKGTRADSVFMYLIVLLISSSISLRLRWVFHRFFFQSLSRAEHFQLGRPPSRMRKWSQRWQNRHPRCWKSDLWWFFMAWNLRLSWMSRKERSKLGTSWDIGTGFWTFLDFWKLGGSFLVGFVGIAFRNVKMHSLHCTFCAWNYMQLFALACFSNWKTDDSWWFWQYISKRKQITRQFSSRLFHVTNFCWLHPPNVGILDPGSGGILGSPGFLVGPRNPSFQTPLAGVWKSAAPWRTWRPRICDCWTSRNHRHLKEISGARFSLHQIIHMKVIESPWKTKQYQQVKNNYIRIYT